MEISQLGKMGRGLLCESLLWLKSSLVQEQSLRIESPPLKVGIPTPEQDGKASFIVSGDRWVSLAGCSSHPSVHMSEIEHVSHRLQMPTSFLCLKKESRQQMPNCQCPMSSYMKPSLAGRMRFVQLGQLNISKTEQQTMVRQE